MTPSGVPARATRRTLGRQGHGWLPPGFLPPSLSGIPTDICALLSKQTVHCPGLSVHVAQPWTTRFLMNMHRSIACIILSGDAARWRADAMPGRVRLGRGTHSAAARSHVTSHVRLWRQEAAAWRGRVQCSAAHGGSHAAREKEGAQGR